MAPAPAAIVGVLLAAGAGSRFDRDGLRLKLLETIPRGPDAGLPVAVAAASRLRGAVDRLLAVVPPARSRSRAELHRRLAEAGCDLVINESPERGLGRSIAVGVAASRDASGWLLHLADMPHGSPSTALAVRRSLLAAPPGIECVAPAFGGRRGHPVGFRASLRGELLALDGDAGARALLEGRRTLKIETDDPGCVLDIDLPDDLDRSPR